MGIKPKTLLRYERAVSSFLLFAVAFYGGVAGCIDSLDSRACKYLEYLWECGEGKSAAQEMLAGIMHCLVRRRALPSAWTLMGMWATCEMPKRTPPLPIEVMLALVGPACAYRQWSLAAALTAAWRGLLRMGEM